MRVHTRSRDVVFTRLTFPDGQRHVELSLLGREDLDATIEARIANADELFDVLLMKDALSASGYVVSLDIRYLLGARMDRRINARHPHTLAVVARLINGAGFRAVRILDPHSPIATDLLGATAVWPVRAARTVLAQYLPSDTLVVAPDAGATFRVSYILGLAAPDTFRVIQGRKHRDAATGALSGFSVEDAPSVAGKTCLIMDDLCDGGGTFVGLATVLREAGAVAVDLFVTHGIFSNGGTLDGIRTIYTTNSYHRIGVLVGPIVMRVEMCRACLV